ncbi:MAG: chromate transporter [Bacillota bacterium]|nr:chromate transporter [Bacillota bacterium]
MIYLTLFWEFLKIGLFGIGGGYATLPFLKHLSAEYGWFSLGDMTNYISLSEITPGAFGVNMATFAGFSAAGVLGGIVATFALALLPFLLITVLCHKFPNFKENKTFSKIFYGVVPVAVALIGTVAFQIFQTSLLHFETVFQGAISWLLFVILLLLAFVKKAGPLQLFLIGGICGLLFL